MQPISFSKTRRRSVSGVGSIVEICWLAPDSGISEAGRLARLLSHQERTRAVRFRHSGDRERFVVRHAWVRSLLARRLGCAPAKVPLTCDEFGKPRVEAEDLRFNVSHSGGITLCVIARGREVGCDIEWRDARLALRAAAEHYFSPREAKTLQSLPDAQWAEGFFNCWTRKEAFIKARGLGLSAPLGDFDVSLAPGEPPALLRGGDGWSLRAFEPVAGLHAAVVAQGEGWRLAHS